MSNSARNLNVMKLKLLVVLLQFINTSKARYVSDSALDLVASAAEPRPVVVEAPEELQAQVLPLILEDYNNDASEKVEKILRKPLAFSYHNDEFPDTSSEEIGDEAKVTRVDQRPESTDYYKYVKNLEPIENEEEAESLQEKNNEEQRDSERVKTQDNEDSDSLEEDHPYSFHSGDYSDNEDLPKKTKHRHRHKNIEYGDHDDHQEEHSDKLELYDNTKQEKVDLPNKNIEYGDNDDHQEENSDKVELYDNTKQEKVDDNIQQGTKHQDHKKSAGGGSYKKGGGHEEHSGHKEEKGEKGDKSYKGHHHHEKGKKGHHTKEDHEKEYEEKGGKKQKHHHEDGYSAEHKKAEKGQKTSKFHEEGNHSKGHSTKGQHSIHKKDEFDKKQEFFDEDYEEDGIEKHGEYFHESDYKKGGSEKGGHTKGGGEEAHYGKKHHYDKGGHYKEGKGHKEAAGHDEHYEHDRKKGEKEGHSGGKKWTYDKGTGGGGGGHKHGGKYQAANSANVPVRVIPQHTDNAGQSNHPLKIFKEHANPIKKSNILHQSVPEYKTGRDSTDNDNYEDGEAIPIKHKRIDKSLILLRRNDDVNDTESEEEEEKPNILHHSVPEYKTGRDSTDNDNYEDGEAIPIKHKRIDNSLILLRRNDDVNDTESEEEEEKPNILHHSVPEYKTGKDVSENDNYEDDEAIPIKHSKKIDKSLILLRRNDDVNESESEEEEEAGSELDSPQESISPSRSVVSNDDGFNGEDSSEFEDELINAAAKNRDKLGSYSVYRLGDYRTKRPTPENEKRRLPLREETIPHPLVETEVYEKPKHVAILTHTEAPLNENPDTVLPLLSENNDATTLSPLVDSTTQEISEFSHEYETTVASNISGEELTEDSEQYVEEESKILSSTMLPIIVKDESKEIDK